MNTQVSYFKKALVVLMAVMMVFTMMPSMAWADGEAENQAEVSVIKSADLFSATAQADVELSQTAETAKTCTYPDTGLVNLRVYPQKGYELYWVKVSHYNRTTGKWDTNAMFKKALSASGSSYATISFSTPTVKKFVAVGERHKFKIEVYKEKNSNTPVENNTYYFDLIRSVGLASVVATDADNQSLSVTKNDDRNYAIACSGDAIKLTCKAASPNYAKIKINGEEAESGAAKEIDLTKCESDENGQKKIKVEVIYTGEANTGKSTEYAILVNKVDYTPKVTTSYGKIVPEEKDIGFGGVKKEITCDKDAEISMTVEVTAPEGSALTYQWYSQEHRSNSTEKQIDGATQNSYHIPTKYAGGTIYFCIVTNTVNGRKFTAESEKCCVEVKPTYASPALIEYTSEDGTALQHQADYKIRVKGKSPDFGGVITYKWYKNDKKETVGGIALEGNGASAAVDTSSVGTYYYYCVISNTVTKEDGTTDTNSDTICDPITIEIKDVAFYFDGKGTEKEPFLIKSADDLKKIKEIVENGNSLSNTYFKLEPETEDRSITMPNDWEPIGKLKAGFADTEQGIGVLPFSGHLNGNDCTIVIPSGGKPLFRYVRDAFVGNLKIYGEKIDGAGLIDEYFVDYGLDGNYSTGVPDAVTIDRVTLVSGSSTKKSGLIHGNASGKNIIKITNSIVEENVTVGYDKSVSAIGSFAGCLNGEIINCKSAAKVYGIDCVGGIAGEKGQSMGPCSVLNCQFTGEIHASGNYSGGMIGSGYNGLGTAPNTPVVTIQNCVVSGIIEGKNCVGGILGGEPGCEDCYANGAGSVTNNVFCGTVSGTEENAIVGAIIGFMKSYNTNQTIDSNYFIESCGAANGIGEVEIIHDADFDITKTGSSVTAAELKDETVVSKLNNAAGSYKNWIQGAEYPTHSDKAVLYAIELSGNYPIKYETGQKFDATGMVITGYYSDGTTTTIRQGDENDKRFKDVKFTGFNSNKRGVQTITVTYGIAKTTYDVTVLYNSSQIKDVFVYFTLLGDTKHGEPTEVTGTHTLKDNNLDEWVGRTKVSINNNTTVYDVMEKMLKANDITWEESNKLGTVYIESLTRNDVTLGEFTNGRNSGWMYTINGKHSKLGVAQQFLSGNEEIIFHYTDDWYKESDTTDWITPGGGIAAGEVEEVKDVTTDTKTGTTTAPTEVKVSEKTNADSTKTKVADVKVSTGNQKEILKQAKEKKSNEIILVVPSKEVGDAAKADVTLEKSFIDSIVKETNAKLTIKTPFGDKTYTQEELKAMSEAATGSTITVAIEKAEAPTDDSAANIAKAKSITKDLKLVARSSKTAKKNIKAVLKNDAKVKASIKELKDLGFTVKYRFYRSTKKAASYKSTVTKKTAAYTNTSGKKGTKYFYKVQVRVYDENGKLVAKTALKQCKYATRTWSKAK